MKSVAQSPVLPGRFSHYFPRLWLLIMMAMILLLAFKIYKGPNLESNLLDLLPQDSSNNTALEVAKIIGETNAKKVFYLIQANDEEHTILATKFMAEELQKSPVVRAAGNSYNQQQMLDLIKTYTNYPGINLPLALRESFEKQKFDKITEQVLRTLYLPLSAGLDRQLKEDPLLLNFRSLEELLSLNDRISFRNGVTLVEDRKSSKYGYIEVALRDSPFKRSAQVKIEESFTKIRSSLTDKFPGIQIIEGGILKFALVSGNSSEQDVKRISSGSIVGIVVLLWLAFRSLKIIIFSAIPIIVGLITGLSFLLLCYPSVHLIALCFGASLIGISIDYCIHYLVARDPKVLKGMALGLLSTCLGFACFFLAPFDGLAQMACLSISGLIASYLTILALFPHIKFPVSAPLKFIQGRKFNFSRAKILHNYKGVLFFSLLLICLIFFSSYKNQFGDKVSLYQQIPPALKEEEELSRKLLGNVNFDSFLVVSANNYDSLLENLEQLEPELNRNVELKNYNNYINIGKFISSTRRQESNRKLILSGIRSLEVQTFLKDLGLAPEIVANYEAKIGGQRNLNFNDFIKISHQSKLKKLFTLKGKDRLYAPVFFKDLKDKEVIKEIASNYPFATYIDQSSSISDLFNKYRLQMTKLIGLASILVLSLLSLYFGLLQAIKIITVPISAMVVSVTGLILMGYQVNVFSTLGLILVMGIGVDFGIFLSTTNESEIPKTILANLMSAFTTVLSFGLLAFSSLPALQTFGITVCLGITTALLISPCVLKTIQHE